MDFLVSALTGQILQSLAFPQISTDTPGGKLQSTSPVRIQYAQPDPTGTTTSYVPCAAPSATIKFGLKQLNHFSDTAFDVYTDSFTAPADPTLPTAFYTSTLTIDSTALRALFPVATDGTSPATVALMGEILSGTLPSVTFVFTAFNNVIKGTEAPAQAVPGASGYPGADVVAALVGFSGLHNVSTNAVKLALGGITAGYTVAITGEGQRVETYLGGAITQDTSWAVLRNTVNLTVHNESGDDITVAGVVVHDGDIVNVGWVDPARLPIVSVNTNIVYYGYDGGSIGNELPDLAVGTFFYAIPNFPARCADATLEIN